MPYRAALQDIIMSVFLFFSSTPLSVYLSNEPALCFVSFNPAESLPFLSLFTTKIQLSSCLNLYFLAVLLESTYSFTSLLFHQSLSYLLFCLLLDQQGGLAQLVHLLAELQVLLLQLEPLVTDADTVVPSCSQRSLQPPHLFLAARKLLTVATNRWMDQRETEKRIEFDFMQPSFLADSSRWSHVSSSPLPLWNKGGELNLLPTIVKSKTITQC